MKLQLCIVQIAIKSLMSKQLFNMYDIVLNIKMDHLTLLSKAFTVEFGNYNPITIPEKAKRSIAKFVFEKLAKKIASRINKDNSKDFKIKFKYHEAFIVYEVLDNNFWHFFNQNYEHTILQKIYHELHQKLT